MQTGFIILSILYVLSLTNCSVNITATKEHCEIKLFDGDYEEIEDNKESFRTCAVSSKKFSLTLLNYSLPSFPNGLFSNIGHLHRFKLIIEENSKLQLLLPGLPDDQLFQNSTFGSVVFEINDLITLVGWKWIHLANLRVSEEEGFEFNAVRSKLVYLHSDFGKIASSRVVIIRILKCQLRWFGENAFAPLSRLKTLELRDNLIENIKRSHLPTRAPELRTLDLGNNKLENLPQDFVEGLNLQSILLGGNKLYFTETQATTILNVKGFPLLLGILWPCICNKSLKISEKFGMFYEEQSCYEDNAIKMPVNFKKTCSLKLN